MICPAADDQDDCRWPGPNRDHPSGYLPDIADYQPGSVAPL